MPQLATATEPPYPFVLCAEQSIDFRGYNVSADSFDSSDPSLSTDGRFDHTKTRDFADVRAPSIRTDVSFGSVRIKGRIHLPPLRYLGSPGGEMELGTNVSVGSCQWVDGANEGFQPGWVIADSAPTFIPIELSDYQGIQPAATTIDGSYYDHHLESGLYEVAELGGRVLVTGTATLLVRDTLQLTGGDFIRVIKGASLRLYATAPSTVLGGQGVIVESGRSADFTYIGLAANLHISVAGASAFFGTIAAPAADCSLGSGGGDARDFIGFCAAKRISLNGHFRFHYDESLPVPPLVTIEPAYQKLVIGETATITLEVFGEEPVTMEWWRFEDGCPLSPLSDEWGSTLVIDPTTPNSVGDYACRLSNASGAKFTGAVILEMVPAPYLTAPHLNSLGQFEFLAFASMAGQYTIHSSSDMLSWIPESSYTFDNDRVMILYATEPSQKSIGRFFRLSWERP